MRASRLPTPMATEVVTRTVLTEPSLPEVHSSVSISRSPFYWRRLLGFLGPGFLISVGYMDPGNWATDIAGGSQFGYTLLFVIMVSNLMAILLQSLSLKLGVATERDLAQLCRESYGPQSELRAVDHGRDRHRGLRSGRGDRLGHRARTALPHSALLRRAHHRARRAADPAPAALGIPLRRGAGHRSHRHHHRALRRADVSLPAGLLAGAAQSPRSLALHRHQSRHALHRHRHSWRHGDAAQSLPALVHRAEPPLQAHARRASARPSTWPTSIRRWRS